MEMNEKEAQAVGEVAQATSLLDTLLESTKIRPGDESYSITKQGIQTFIGNLLANPKLFVIGTQNDLGKLAGHPSAPAV